MYCYRLATALSIATAECWPGLEPSSRHGVRQIMISHGVMSICLSVCLSVCLPVAGCLLVRVLCSVEVAKKTIFQSSVFLRSLSE